MTVIAYHHLVTQFHKLCDTYKEDCPISAFGGAVRLLRASGREGGAILREPDEQEEAGSDRRQEARVQLEMLSPLLRHGGAAANLLTSITLVIFFISSHDMSSQRVLD